MALQKLVLKPGVNKEGTNYSNEDGFYNSDKVRFRSGYAEKIGGWQNISYANTYYGIARSLWAWVSLASETLVGIGTTQKFYVTYGSNYYDITPLSSISALTTPYFSTTAGSLAVSVTATNHNITTDSFVTFTKAYTTLAADITYSSTSIIVASTTGFPTSGTILIDNEQINYVGISSTQLGTTSVTRGANQTVAAAHSSGALSISEEAITVGGVNLMGQFRVIQVIDTNTYLITTSSPATGTYFIGGTGGVSSSTLTVSSVISGTISIGQTINGPGIATGTTIAGGSGTTWTMSSPQIIPSGTQIGVVTSGGSGTYALYQLNAGNGSYASLSGWGSMPWSYYGWGSSTVTATTTPIRLWSQSNYDQDLIFAPRYGAIYWWTKNTSTFPRAITLNTQANTVSKISSVGALYTSGSSTITILDNTGINTGSIITGAGIPANTYVTTAYTFGTTVPISNPINTIPTSTWTTSISLSAPAPITVTATSAYSTWPSSGLISNGGEIMVYQNLTVVGTTTTMTITQRSYNGTAPAAHGVNWVGTFAGSPSISFSYAGKHVPNETLLIATTSQNAFTIAFGANPYSPVDFNTAFDPLLVRWSDQDNPYEWVPETTNQAGEQRLSNGSTIIAAANTRQEVLIWTDTALYSMQYLGPPYVFGINLLMDNLSIASQNAAITVNNVTYWMGVDRFYQYSGRVETLPCTLRQFIYGDINRNQLAQVCCGTNEGFNEVWWFYPSADSLSNNRYVIYNHLENTWVYGNINRTAWLDTQLENYPIGAFSTETTFLPNAITASQTSILLDDVSSFPSSGVVTINSEDIAYTNANYNTNYLEGCTRAANNTTAASHIAYTSVSFKTNNQLMFHESGWDDASSPTVVPFEAYIESSDFDIGDGMNFAYVWRILPDLSFSGSTATTPQCQLTVKVRQNSGAPYTVGSTDSNTVVRTSTYQIEQYTGQVYTRVRGRQMAFRMESRVSDGTGIFWQMGMMRIDVRPDGRR